MTRKKEQEQGVSSKPRRGRPRKTEAEKAATKAAAAERRRAAAAEKRAKAAAERDPTTGHFLPNNKPEPGPGRPKKPKNPTLGSTTEKRMKKTAHQRALAMVDEFMGQSRKVIGRAIADRYRVARVEEDGTVQVDEDGKPLHTVDVGGDVKVAMWLIDRAIPKDSTSLPFDMDVDLSNMKGVIDASQTVVEWVVACNLTIEQGSKMLNLLMQYAQMRAFEHIDELRTLVQEFEEKSSTGVSKLDGSMVPAWGRLADRLVTAEPANKTPAE